MVLEAVEQESVTDCALVYAPAGTEKVGVAAVFEAEFTVKLCVTGVAAANVLLPGWVA